MTLLPLATNTFEAQNAEIVIGYIEKLFNSHWLLLKTYGGFIHVGGVQGLNLAGANCVFIPQLL